MNKVLKRDHLNKNVWAVLSRGTVQVISEYSVNNVVLRNAKIESVNQILRGGRLNETLTPTIAFQ